MIVNFTEYLKINNEEYPTLFEEKIQDGIKFHTLRESNGRNIKQGTLLHLAYGQGTKNYRCFKIVTCTEVIPIVIDIKRIGEKLFQINSIKDTNGNLFDPETLLMNDGLEDPTLSKRFFNMILGKQDEKVVGLYLINWGHRYFS